jgi:hypothetical protein
MKMKNKQQFLIQIMLSTPTKMSANVKNKRSLPMWLQDFGNYFVLIVSVSYGL